MSDEPKDIPALVTAASGRGSEAWNASARLAEAGPSAVEAVIEAVRRSSPPSEPLRNALLRMHDPAVVPALLGVLSDSDPFLPVIAAQALGRIGDRRAVEPLLEVYRDEKRSESKRGWAAQALGELGDESAVPELLKTARAIAKGAGLKERAALLRFTVIALARLGNQEAADIVISMATRRGKAINDEAAIALKHVVGRGLFPALQKARRSKSSESRQAALEAIFYLGLRESIEELISYVEDGDSSSPELVDEAVRRLNELTGEQFAWDAEPADLREWWKQNEGRFRSNVSYRRGKPFDLADYADLLAAGAPGDRERLLAELHVITGEEFGLDPSRPTGEQDEVIGRAQKWLREQAGEYERGAVYKYGHKQSLEHIFDSPAKQSK